jgi:Transposase IS66 family
VLLRVEEAGRGHHRDAGGDSRQWKVIQTVREKLSCRECETITQPLAPFHVTPRGFPGPNLLAMVLFEKFGQHQPLNRQSERYRREGIDLSLSTLADQVGACPTALQPLFAPIAHRRAAAREDATVPILAKSKTVKGHIWTCVRDDWPFGGRAPPAALYYASRDRRHEYPARHLHGFTGTSCRLTPTAAKTSPHACRGRSPQHCAGRTLGECPAREECGGDLADRARSGQAHRRAVRRHQWAKQRRASAGASGAECTPCGGAGSRLREQRSRLSRSSSVAEPTESWRGGCALLRLTASWRGGLSPWWLKNVPHRKKKDSELCRPYRFLAGN